MQILSHMLISTLAKQQSLQIPLGHSGINDQPSPTLERFKLKVLIIEVIYVYNSYIVGELFQLIIRHVSIKWNLE